jgi:pyroglutamyl-peptidase
LNRMMNAHNKKKISVLLTGFEPFGRFRTNPSEVIVREYSARRLKDIDGASVKLTKLILPVHSEVFKVLEKKTGTRRFDLILHFGLAPKAQCTRLERRARNVLDFLIPDNRGLVIKKKKIRPKGPRYLYSTVSVKALGKELKANHKRFVISNNAGSYICNLLFYSSLLKNKKKGQPALVGFVHVPRFSVFSKGRSISALDIIMKNCIQQVVKRA